MEESKQIKCYWMYSTMVYTPGELVADEANAPDEGEHGFIKSSKTAESLNIDMEDH